MECRRIWDTTAVRLRFTTIRPGPFRFRVRNASSGVWRGAADFAANMVRQSLRIWAGWSILESGDATGDPTDSAVAAECPSGRSTDPADHSAASTNHPTKSTVDAAGATATAGSTSAAAGRDARPTSPACVAGVMFDATDANGSARRD